MRLEFEGSDADNASLGIGILNTPYPLKDLPMDPDGDVTLCKNSGIGSPDGSSGLSFLPRKPLAKSQVRLFWASPHRNHMKPLQYVLGYEPRALIAQHPIQERDKYLRCEINHGFVFFPLPSRRSKAPRDICVSIRASDVDGQIEIGKEGLLLHQLFCILATIEKALFRTSLS